VLYAIYVPNTFTAKNTIDLTILNMVGYDYGPLIEHLTGRFPDVQVMTVYSVKVQDSIANKRRMTRVDAQDPSPQDRPTEENPSSTLP